MARALEPASARVPSQNYGAELLIGVRAVARHPHFQHYVSPFPGDQNLGAAVDWPDVEALLLLDSFAQDDRPSVWRRVDAHTQPVWILLQARPGLSSAGLTGPCVFEVPGNVQF